MEEQVLPPRPQDPAWAKLPQPIAGIFQKVLDSVSSALQSLLMDTLTGEFHTKFTAMWNSPGDRDAARALRHCDRVHRETAVQVVHEVLGTQLALLAKAVAAATKATPAKNAGLDQAYSAIEAKVALLEGQVSAIEIASGVCARATADSGKGDG